jgi:rare lipoprotein A (peptidoglycan hydrolase)
MKSMWIILCCFALSASAGPSAEGWATYYTVASCKREGTSGVLTASGKPYVESELTCALPRSRAKAMNIRFGDSIRVTCLTSGKRITLRYTDTGPGKRAQKRGVVIDLTPAAMRALGGERAIKSGRIRVRIDKED